MILNCLDRDGYLGERDAFAAYPVTGRSSRRTTVQISPDHAKRWGGAGQIEPTSVATQRRYTELLTSISKYGKTILPYFWDLLIYLENMDTDPSIVFPDAHSAALTLSNFTDTLIVAELKVKAFNEHLLDITVRRD